ncbi:MAG: aspartate--tRNA(Asn) ligase [Deltaproteobacteria bacterium]|nr:aspartate--tRNA(Asn) ligase [Deltaproteobacteria bacterium]
MYSPSFLKEYLGQTVTLRGWVHSFRDHKNVGFLILRRDDSFTQCVMDYSEPLLKKATRSLSRESTVEVTGTVTQCEFSKYDGIEVIVKNIKILSTSASLPFLLSHRNIPLETRLDYRVLDLRRPESRLIFEIQTFVEHKMREFFIENGFIEIHSPKLLGFPSESGSELFRLDYFGRTAYLAQSPQFYKQMAICSGFDKVFEIGPVFRANPSYTSRHDTEFTSIDCEIAWINSHHDIMNFEENLLSYLIEAVLDRFGEKIFRTFGRELKAPKLPFPRLTFQEVLQVLQKTDHQAQPTDLSQSDEINVCQFIKSRFDHEFVFVTDYPWKSRPFYHMKSEHNPALTKSFDLLWNGLEITTGAQREHRYNILGCQAKEKLRHPQNVQFFLDFFKYGAPPHGGFGLGLTRFLMCLLGFKNVREVTFVYRGPTRLVP